MSSVAWEPNVMGRLALTPHMVSPLTDKISRIIKSISPRRRKSIALLAYWAVQCLLDQKKVDF